MIITVKCNWDQNYETILSGLAIRDVPHTCGSLETDFPGAAATSSGKPSQLPTNSSTPLQATVRVSESSSIKITRLSIDLAKGLSIRCDDKAPEDNMY